MTEENLEETFSKLNINFKENEVENLKKEIEKLRKENKLLKSGSQFKFSEETPLGILQILSNNIYKKEFENSVWKNSPFENLDKMKSDLSGKTGELLIASFCKKGNIPYIYKDDDTNSTDGTYDIIIKEKKIEIKTAKLGKQKTFQHECLRISGYDYLLFLDICPSYYYITIIPKYDLKLKSDILDKKAHLRKGTTDVYKIDWTEKTINSVITKGYSLKVENSTKLDDLILFLNDKII